MAEIDTAIVEKLASLCKIACTEEEKTMLLQDLQKVLSYVDQLSEVPTDDVEPCTYVTEMAAEAPLRDDEPSNTLLTKDFIALTFKNTGGMVRVPNILKQ